MNRIIGSKLLIIVVALWLINIFISFSVGDRVIEIHGNDPFYILQVRSWRILSFTILGIIFLYKGALYLLKKRLRKESFFLQIEKYSKFGDLLFLTMGLIFFVYVFLHIDVLITKIP